MSSTQPKPEQIIVSYSLDSVLDEFSVPIKNRGLSIAQNVVYRRSGGFGKRTGSTIFGSLVAPQPPLDGPVISGRRWSRGSPSPFTGMVVQSSDTLYLADPTGFFPRIGPFAPGSLPAFYASAYNATNTGGAGPSDVLIMAYGSGPPMKWDGNHFGALSVQIPNLFRGCEFFEEHIFFWGDPSYPDIIFGTDLANPEAYTFSYNFGGYKIGRGDGDPFVRRCIAVGSTLYIFKTNSVYTLTGFDFYTGQYQFQVTALLSGNGTTAPHSVARLRNALVWWSGQNFYRLAVGDSEATPLGSPIMNTIAQVAQGNQSVIRAVAGDFLVASVEGFRVYNNVYLCAVDTGSGSADTILMYDEQVSSERGKPAWTRLTGFSISSFIPWTAPGDQRYLYMGTKGGQVLNFGGDAYADVTTSSAGGGAWGGIWNAFRWAGEVPLRVPIAVVLQTGRNDAGSPNQTKRLDRIFVDAETTAATMLVTITSDTGISPAEIAIATPGLTGGGKWQMPWSTLFWSGPFNSVYVGTEVPVTPEVVGKNFTVKINESSNASAYEVVALSYHAIQEGVQF